MKQLISLTLVVLALLPWNAFSQTKPFAARVKITNKHTVNQKTELGMLEPLQLKAGTVLITERSFEKNEQQFTATWQDTLLKDTIIYHEVPTVEPLKLTGWANIVQDPADPSILHVNFWQGSKYDQEADFFIQLENRESVKFWFNTLEGGPLTIPFKYRTGYSEGEINVPTDFSTDINIGAYLGFSIGQVTYSYRKHELHKPSKWSISIGPFASVSSMQLNESNTLTALEPFGPDESTDIATVAAGIGIMVSVYDFRLGCFAGRDFAGGQAALKWDYHNRTWVGIGLGYNIGLLWKGGK